MYRNFDLCITDFSSDNEPGDYWYDCAIVESTEMLSKFKESDWKCLLGDLANKPIFWKIRLVECLGDLNNSYELEVILYLINTDDNNLFNSCLDSLRSMGICGLTESD